MLLSVVVPCRDEEENVRRFDAELLPSLSSLGVPFELLIVDDGSTDGTADAALELARGYPVRLTRHERNLGLGRALRTGFAGASGDWIATLDADLTFAPVQLQSLLACQRATGADLVAGSPFLRPEGLAAIPWSRRFPTWIANAFYRGLLDPRFTAYTPIFRLYRAEILKSLPLQSGGYEINAEIAALFIRARRRVAEAPAVLTVRRLGVSKLSSGRELGRHLRLVGRLLAGPAAGSEPDRQRS